MIMLHADFVTVRLLALPVSPEHEYSDESNNQGQACYSNRYADACFCSCAQPTILVVTIAIVVLR